MHEPLKPADDTIPKAAAPVALPDVEILDREALLHRIGGDWELLNEIVDLFLDEAPRLVADVRTALARNDTSTALRSAHRLNGAAGAMSALRIAALAAQLESRGRQDQWGEASALCQALDGEITRLRSVLGALARKNAA